MKDRFFNRLIHEKIDVVVSEENMHDPTLNSMLINLGLKNDEFKPVTLKVELVKEVTGRFTHNVDLSTLNLFSCILTTVSKEQGRDRRG